LQIAEVGLKHDVVVQTTKIRRLTSKETRGLALCCPANSGAGLPGLHLKSETIVEDIARSFTYIDQYILVLFVALRILQCHIHLAENPEVVKLLLRGEQIALTECVAGMKP